jgi:hypothetical protein
MALKFLVTGDARDLLAEFGLGAVLEYCVPLGPEGVQGFTLSSVQSARSLAPGFVIGIIKGPEGETGQFETLMRGMLPQFRTDRSVFTLTPQTAPTLPWWLIERLRELTEAALLNSSRAGLELGRMRILLEESEAALKRLELQPGRLPALSLQYQTLHDGGYEPISGRDLTLDIDNPPEAPVAIDLLFRSPPGLTDAPLNVRLLASESATEIASWLVRERDIRDGWNRFVLPKRLDPLRERIAVLVQRAPEPSRTSIGVVRPPNASKTNGAGLNDHPVPVVRVWAGLLGVDHGAPLIGHEPEHAGKPGAAQPEFLTASDLLSLAKPLTPADQPLVTWEAERGGLQVHPRGRTPTLAVIERVPVSSLSRLRLRVELAHPEAAPTSFGLWAGPSGASPPPEFRDPSLVDRLAKLAGRELPQPRWLALSGKDTGELEQVFEPPITGELDIYLATQNPGASAFCWAVFTDIVAQRDLLKTETPT